MWKFNGWKVKEVKGENVVRLFLVNEESDKSVHIDCPYALNDYNLAPLVGKEYQQFNTVSELVKIYDLSKREVSTADSVKIIFKITA